MFKIKEIYINNLAMPLIDVFKVSGIQYQNQDMQQKHLFLPSIKRGVIVLYIFVSSNYTNG